MERETVRAINRGTNAVIEATTHATRYVLNHDQEHLKKINYYNQIVKRCGRPEDKKAMETLYELCKIR